MQGLSLDQALAKTKAALFDGLASAWNNPTRDGRLMGAIQATANGLPADDANHTRDKFITQALQVMQTFSGRKP